MLQVSHGLYLYYLTNILRYFVLHVINSLSALFLLVNCSKTIDCLSLSSGLEPPPPPFLRHCDTPCFFSLVD